MNRSDSYLLTNSISGNLGGLYVRSGDMTLLNQAMTNFQMYVADPAGPATNTTLNINNSFIATLSAGLNSFLIGGVEHDGDGHREHERRAARGQRRVVGGDGRGQTAASSTCMTGR